MGKTNEKRCKDYFGERLKSLRNEKGISQKVLADELGISKGAVSFYETCQNTPDIEILDAVSKYFNVSYDYLLGRTENKTAAPKLKAVCDYTRLSEKAIEIICAISKSPDSLYSYALNLILSSPKFAAWVLSVRSWLNELGLLKGAINIFEQKIREYGEEPPEDIMKFAAEISLEESLDIRSCVYSEAWDIMREQDNLNYREYIVQNNLKGLLDELKRRIENG